MSEFDRGKLRRRNKGRWRKEEPVAPEGRDIEEPADVSAVEPRSTRSLKSLDRRAPRASQGVAEPFPCYLSRL